MSVPLLVTKLYKPAPRKDWIERPALIKKINDGLSARLILVSAPAGFGKSSIISAWLNQIEINSAWFSLDEDDNDPIRFLSYMIAALQNSSPEFGKNILPALNSPQPPEVASFLPFIVDDLIDTGELVLVLDDYHLIKNNILHDLFDVLLKYAPPTFHLVISTRSDPPIQLAHWRAKQQMIEIRTNDLRFTETDTSKLIQVKNDIQLDDRLIYTLNQRTEGWITGLQMALLSMQHIEDKESYIGQFSSSNRYILDYLLEEVLTQQSQEIRDFLLITARLPKLCASLCNSVTGFINSQQILEQLENENLFTIALDDQRKWYRYHHLFSDLLQQQLSSNPKIDTASIYLKASQWYEENREFNLAVEFAFLAGDVARAISILNIPGMYALTVFGLLSLEKYVDQIDYELVKQYPNLLLSYAWIYLATSRVELVERCLVDIENHYQLHAKEVHENVSQSAAIHLLLAELQIIRGNVNVHQSNFESVLDLCEQAKQYLDEDAKDFAVERYEILWSLLHFNFALAYEYLGELVLGEDHFKECIFLSKKYHNAHLIPVATSHLAQLQQARGQLSSSLNTYKEAIQYMEANELPASPLAGIAYAGLGHLYYQMDMLEDAETSFLRGLELARLWNHWESINSANFGLACVFAARQLWDKVDAQLRQLCEKINEIDSPWGKQNIFAQAAKFSIQRDDISSIEKWVNNFQPLLKDEIIYSHVYELLVYTRAQIKLQNYEEAKQNIKLLCNQCEEKHWTEFQIQCLIIRSILSNELNAIDQSITYMKSAILLAEGQGYKRLFLDEFPAIKNTLQKLAQDGEVGQYTSELLDHTNGDRNIRSNKEISIDPDALSEREIEVLAKIAEGFTNQQAALALHIAEGTIKNHLKNIFSKLHVTSRTQAIMIAREKGYLV